MAHSEGRGHRFHKRKAFGRRRRPQGESRRLESILSAAPIWIRVHFGPDIRIVVFVYRHSAGPLADVLNHRFDCLACV
jgi:hypothetical protein